MASLTAPRRPVKPARSCKLYDGSPMLLVLTVGKQTNEYFVDRHEAKDCYRLRKPLPEQVSYDVDLAAGTCECMGWLRHSHCKHLESLTALKGAGKLVA
jgi:hypothetical protein